MPRGLIAKQRSLQRLCTASTTFHRRSEASSGPSFSSDALTRSAGSLRPDRNCQGLFRGGSANHIRSPAWAVMGRKNRDEGEGWARRGGLLLLDPSPSRAALLAVAVVGWCTHGADAAVAGWPLFRHELFARSARTARRARQLFDLNGLGPRSKQTARTGNRENLFTKKILPYLLN